MRTCIALLLLLVAMQPARTSPAVERVPDSGPSKELPSNTVPVDAPHLPLYEVRAARDSATFALLITGDGGWANLDRNVSAELARRGVSVVGLSSLKYFYHSRTPELAAHDIAQTLHHYLDAWHDSRIVLIGYSFGADVMPFIVNRLPQDLQSRLISVNLLGLAADATFQVPVGAWIHGNPEKPRPVAPELSRLNRLPVLCVYGEGENESLCPSLSQGSVTSVRVGIGHHFGNEFGTLAQKIVEFAARTQPLHARR